MRIDTLLYNSSSTRNPHVQLFPPLANKHRKPSLINSVRNGMRIPPGLKPNVYEARSGTAEAMPFQIAFMRPVLAPGVALIRQRPFSFCRVSILEIC
jgi:hypothetical protein